MNDDGARLRIHALEKRMHLAERDVLRAMRWVLVLGGLVVAAVLVCALELRHVAHLVERMR